MSVLADLRAARAKLDAAIAALEGTAERSLPPCVSRHGENLPGPHVNVNVRSGQVWVLVCGHSFTSQGIQRDGALLWSGGVDGTERIAKGPAR